MIRYQLEFQITSISLCVSKLQYEMESRVEYKWAKARSPDLGMHKRSRRIRWIVIDTEKNSIVLEVMELGDINCDLVEWAYQILMRD